MLLSHTANSIGKFSLWLAIANTEFPPPPKKSYDFTKNLCEADEADGNNTNHKAQGQLI